MPRYLHLIDVSATIHGADTNFSENNSHGFPTGGIYNTLRLLTRKIVDLNKDVVVFCFDRKTERQRAEGSTYKAGRKRWSKSMYYQASLMEEMLPKWGFQVAYQDAKYDNNGDLSADSREADEEIYNIVKDNLQYFEHCYIYGTDRDLACCITPKCTLVSTHSNVHDITYENYETTVDRDYLIPYNSILLFKILVRDKSDNIKGSMQYKKFNEIIKALRQANFPIHQLNLPDAIQFVIERMNCSEEERALAWENYNKVVPRPTDFVLDLNPTYNLDMIEAYCSLLSMKSISNKFKIKLTGAINPYWYDELVRIGEICKQDLIERNADNPKFRIYEDFVPKYFNIAPDNLRDHFSDRLLALTTEVE